MPGITLGVGVKQDGSVQRVANNIERTFTRTAGRVNGALGGISGKPVDSLSRPLGKITGQADEFTKSLEASNARVLAFGASVAIINGVSQAFRGLISNVREVEKAFADINVVLGVGEKELKQFGRGIFEVAKNTAQGFDEIGRAHV